MDIIFLIWAHNNNLLPHSALSDLQKIDLVF